MKEVGMVNRRIDAALGRQGHMDELMVVDAEGLVSDVRLLLRALARNLVEPRQRGFVQANAPT